MALTSTKTYPHLVTIACQSVGHLHVLDNVCTIACRAV